VDTQRQDHESRRSFLRRGGLVAAGGVAATAATTVLAASPAGAGTISSVPAYVPVGPVRVYDSRTETGKLFPLQERNLQTGFEPEDLIIGVTHNLTVTETEGPGGWLAMFPGDIDWPGTSNVNWFGPGQNLSNNAFVRIPESGFITIRCGGQGPTQFVIDVIGISALVDATGLAAVQDLSATANLSTYTEQ
jgi:hypothetical protein